MSTVVPSPNDLLVFLIGRPGSGKSTFAKYLTCAVVSTRVLSLNDYDMLLARAEKLEAHRIQWQPNGQFEVLDRSVFDGLFDEIVEVVKSNRGKRPIIVEFSRPVYVDTFAKLSNLADRPYVITYLDAPLETCIQRNAARAPDYPINTIPEAVIRKYYSNDDLLALQATYPGHVRVINNVAASLHALEREANLLLEDLLGTANVKSSRAAGFLRKEIAVACLLIGYLGAFLGIGLTAWRSGSTSIVSSIVGSIDQLPFLRTVLYVAAAGGLGSTTYCIRAFYHYYIYGVFDFDRFKWWYLFRPLTGPVLAMAVFAIVKGGVVALGAGHISGPSAANTMWFGIAYLAGFGTEQVIEWLRRASKSIFGESRVQPEDGAG